MFSSTELFPLDCEPTTAIWGRSIGFWTCRAKNDQPLLSERKPGITYSNCCKDILQFIDESNELGVIDIDPACAISLGRKFWELMILTSGRRARPW